jgi:hypothetical protein
MVLIEPVPKLFWKFAPIVETRVVEPRSVPKARSLLLPEW